MLPDFSVSKIVTLDFHVDDSAKGGYNMIVDRYILIEIGLNKKLSEQIVEAGGGPLRGSTPPTIYLGTYEI